MKTKEIIVIGKIGNQEKQIILFKDYPLSDTYHVTIDKEYQGMVMRVVSGWKVFPHEESWLKGENCDLILQAVLNVENPNS